MGNRIGIIFHDSWNSFSPLLYSHNGADLMPFKVQRFLINYDEKYNRNSTDGHLYNPEHMMLGFIQSIDKDIHMRIENLSEEQIKNLSITHEYPNCFDGGCWIINVSISKYGDTNSDSSDYCLIYDNIVTDELKSMWDSDW